MKSIGEIVQSPGYKNFMKYLYGWGASAVLAGALFKIQHWPGAGIMLTIGMSVEVAIFFFSAFEPLHEDLDWTLVFPELAHIDLDEDEDGHGLDKSDYAKGPDTTADVAKGTAAVGLGAGLKKLESMMETIDVNSDVFANLGNGLSRLSDTASNLSDISNATVATNEYVDTIKVASESAGNLAEGFNQSKENLLNSIDGLSSSYQSTADLIVQNGNDAAQKLSESGANLLASYQQLAGSIEGGSENISNGANEYTGKITEINKNLGALNSVYELQLQETDTHLKNSKKVFDGMDNMMSNLKQSADATQQYKDQVLKLTDNIGELNGVYGNMLSSLNLINS